MSKVVLVDNTDQAVGTADKRRAHLKGWLHRALSVFVFDEAGRLLLQKRASEKYHSGGQWSNTCCSHPQPGEAPIDAATRRLSEEMGFSCSLSPAFTFTYRASVGPNLIEHEYDHVFTGIVKDVVPEPDPTEVADWAWVTSSALRNDVSANPDRYTIWFRRILERTLRTVTTPDGVLRNPSPDGST